VELVADDRAEGRPFELELPEGVRLQIPCDLDEGSLVSFRQACMTVSGA
jgi:hypothetical protein